MGSFHLIPFQPTLSAIAETFDILGWQYQAMFTDDRQSYRGLQLYSGQSGLEADILYVVTDEYRDVFPADTYSYLSSAPLSSKAGHICVFQHSPKQLLEHLLALFQQYHDLEQELDEMVFSETGLDELCNWYRKVTDNPVCIHDSWFVITAMSDDLPDVMHPESVAASLKQYIPHKFIDAFQSDRDYLDSYSHKEARVWISSHQPESNRCIYANIWDEDTCIGRIVIIEENRRFQAGHFLLAECLAQRAALLLRRQRAAGSTGYHSMDSTVCNLLRGETGGETDAAMLLDCLGWKKTDRYLCVRLQDQQPDMAAIFGNMLHSDLFQRFPDSYILFIEHQQCMVLNVSSNAVSVAQVRHNLAPLCRDYCLYAGISSPVWGIKELHYAFLQAGIALERAFYLKNDRWVISFSTCALDYMLKNMRMDLLPGHLVAPELLALIDYDERKGTEYFVTLRVFLQSERNIPEASKTLIIHRTTLVYRIKRIQALTGLNLDDPEQRLYLQLSLKLLEYR